MFVRKLTLTTTIQWEVTMYQFARMLCLGVLLGGCNRDGLAPNNENPDLLTTSTPDLVQAPDLVSSATPQTGACSINVINARSGEKPVLVANADGYLLLINGMNVRYLMLGKEFGEPIVGPTAMPGVLHDCPYAGDTCSNFSVSHAASAPDGFLFDYFSHDYYAALVARVNDQGSYGFLDVASKGNHTFSFGVPTFTQDGAYAILPAGPVAAYSLWYRSDIGYIPAPNFAYGIKENGRGDTQLNASIAHSGDTVAFSATDGKNLFGVIVNAPSQHYIEVPIAYVDAMHPRVEPQRVIADPAGFAVLWKSFDAQYQPSRHIRFMDVNGIKSDRVDFSETIRDVVRVDGGYMAIQYEGPSHHSLAFLSFDDAFVGNTLRAQTGLEGDAHAAGMPTLACGDSRHCAAAWPTMGGDVMFAAMTCH